MPREGRAAWPPLPTAAAAWPPHSVLAPVDAPLDEVNTERFVRLVRDMSRDTQFIVITHSRRTMEAADVLYGVTMEEAGCSRLVSVNFAEVEA